MTRVHIGPSRIHAEGLFTTIDITKGTKIIRYIGKKGCDPIVGYDHHGFCDHHGFVDGFG